MKWPVNSISDLCQNGDQPVNLVGFHHATFGMQICTSLHWYPTNGKADS